MAIDATGCYWRCGKQRDLNRISENRVKIVCQVLVVCLESVQRGLLQQGRFPDMGPVEQGVEDRF